MPSEDEYVRGLLELDRIVEEEADGRYVEPIDGRGPFYDVKAIDEYCKKRGIDPSALTEDDLKRFEV